MDEAAENAIQMVRHIVGNHVAEPAIYHGGKSYRTADDIRRIQTEVTDRLAGQLDAQQIADEGARGVLEALRLYDWGEPASYKTFRDFFDAYVAPVQQEVVRLRNELSGQGNR